MEQYANYSNYVSLVDNRNNRYKGGEMEILLSQRGEEKALCKAKCEAWQEEYECEVSGSKRMKLIKVFREVLKTWSQEGKLLLAFCMVSTVIKYNMLCHMWAMR